MSVSDCFVSGSNRTDRVVAAAATLGPPDRALLDRLRTVALLLRAVEADLPELRGMALGLVFQHERLRVVESIGQGACRRLAVRCGWSDLFDASPSRPSDFVRLQNGIFERTARTELPDGCPPGLLRLLEEISHAIPPSAADVAFLARAQWDVQPLRRYLRPLLPAQPSAHEVLDALCLAGRAGGVGAGPLARFAQQAATQRLAGAS